MLDPAHADELTERQLWLPDAVRLALPVDDPATAGIAAQASVADAAAEPTPGRTATAQHCRGLIDSDPAPLAAAADTYRRSGWRPLQLAKTLEDASVLLARRGDLPAARAALTEAAEQYTGLRTRDSGLAGTCGGPTPGWVCTTSGAATATPAAVRPPVGTRSPQPS